LQITLAREKKTNILNLNWFNRNRFYLMMTVHDDQIFVH
jgi:hypothetical protein